jgi:glutaconate CoA-transferase subunit B
MNYTTAELMAVLMSREIKDGEVIGGGGDAQLIPRAAQLLAHLCHGPNMRLHLLTRTNLFKETLSLSLFESIADWRTAKWAESYWVPSEIYDELKLFRKRVLFLSGIQIDMYGNINLFGIGRNFGKLGFRGPGGFGAATAGTYAARYYIFTTRHNRRIFVKRCDYITCVGWGNGGKDARTKLRLPGGGPVLCITPLCVMDFDEETKAIRLKSLHPGVDIDNIVANTGFEVIIPYSVPKTEEPTEEELTILRTRIDPEGLLQRLTLK